LIKKYIISALVFCFLFIQPMAAQIVVQSDKLPKAGDIIYLKQDMLNHLIWEDNQGSSKWDLSKAITPLVKTIEFVKSEFSPTGRGTYQVFEMKSNKFSFLYSRTNRGLEEIGFVLQYYGTRQPKIPVYYDKPVLISAKSLNYPFRNKQEASYDFKIQKRELPADIQRNLPKYTKQIRVIGTRTVMRSTDAYGVLELPDEDLDVIRIRVNEYHRIKIYDALTGKIIPFLDDRMITDLICQDIWTNAFEFYSNKYKYLASKVNFDAQGTVKSIQYQVNKPETGDYFISDHKTEFQLYPNPTYNIAKIFISNLDSGRYKLILYNIIGKKIWDKEIEVNGQTIIRENFNFLAKGTYLIAIQDENGNVLKTTRLNIISV